MTECDLSRAVTVRDAWVKIRAAFRAAGLETADFDARLLTAALTGLEPHQLVTGDDARLSDTLRERLQRASLERLGGKPVHRVLGAREFYGLRLKMSGATLEPRPDTETLVDAILPLVRARLAKTGSCAIADLGAGTGAIGLALVSECPEATCLGVDISAEAVAMATENARSLGLSAHYRAVEGDWLAGIDGRFDIIVSNPPYIPSGDMAALSREVSDHDPALALNGGADGLEAYRSIARQAPLHLEAGGYLGVEIGMGQTAAVTSIFENAGFIRHSLATDLGGVERALVFGLR